MSGRESARSPLPEGVSYAGASVCPRCKRIVRHKPFGGPHRWHGCRLRWVARRVAQAESHGWDEGYRFALENVADPMVYADLNEYGTGWAGLVARGGITITSDEGGNSGGAVPNGDEGDGDA